ncbi:helix-loop-helix protein delilah-like [Cylas formicarius]|uniref:helix-loop-helix protein delilah-like n=1 Tax=Cylas formicarius TaxID=197179 RepID=UPI0029584DEF|nr:helix-loop-helix protein delilah-like [Cylas formicarius]
MLQYDEELSERLGLTIQSSNYPTDSNNNSADKRGDKYSLRPRSARRKKICLDDNDLPEDAIDSVSPPSSKSGRGNLHRPKQKSAPLSKYRRKTANARERSRMREINQAFEALRKAVPQITPNQQQNEKLTKITTLRLAMKYISALSSALSSCPAELPQQDLFSECSELESFLLESDGESLPLRSDISDHSITPEEFSVDFDDSLTPGDFGRLTPDFSNHLHFDPFLVDFS